MVWFRAGMLSAASCTGHGILGCGTRCITLLVLMAAVGEMSFLRADEIPQGAVEAGSVFLRVRRSAEIPALERGQLKQINSQSGDTVQAGQVLAALDDHEAKLTLDLVRIDHQIAVREHEESVAISIAEATLQEAEQVLAQARLDAEAAKTMAAQDIAIRHATMASDVSKGELERMLAARKAFSSSVSEQQLVKLTLTRDQDLLTLEKARLDQAVELLRSRSRDAIVLQQEAAVRRLEQTLAQARSHHETAILNLQRLEKQVAIAEARVDRRNLKAPFAGVVVETLKEVGEWVEPGESVMRLISLDTLYVEGFVSAQTETPTVRGQRVTVVCGSSGAPFRVEGKLVFVSPEFDPLNKQVQVRAEISNPEHRLLPGQPARMWIVP